MDTQEEQPLTDRQFIDLLWKCAYWGMELMPSDTPDSRLKREWAKWMEQATAERQRREAES